MFRLKFGKKDTLLSLKNEHCLKMISVDATINGSGSDVTGVLNSTIMDISHAFYLGLSVQILTKLRACCHSILCYCKFCVLCFNLCLFGQNIMSNGLFMA